MTARMTKTRATTISSHVRGRIWKRGAVDMTGDARSGAAEAHVTDDEGDARGAARQPFEVGADGGDVLQHALERGRHRGLAYGLRDSSVTDHEPFDADGEVAADRVGAGVQADGGAHEETVAHLGQQFLLRLV